LVVGDDNCQNEINRVSLTNSLNDVSSTSNSNQDANNSTSLNNNNNNISNNKANEDISRVAKWAIGFEKMLEDPLGLHVFTVNIIKLNKEFPNCLKI
jgi:hypothetical protein